MRAWVQMEGHEAAIGVGLDPLRDQTIKGERLVERAGHQGLEDVCIEPLRGGTGLQIEGVEAVECALEAKAQASLLEGIRIGIGEVIEARGQGRLAVHGYGM